MTMTPFAKYASIATSGPLLSADLDTAMPVTGQLPVQPCRDESHSVQTSGKQHKLLLPAGSRARQQDGTCSIIVHTQQHTVVLTRNDACVSCSALTLHHEWSGLVLACLVSVTVDPTCLASDSRPYIIQIIGCLATNGQSSVIFCIALAGVCQQCVHSYAQYEPNYRSY